MGQHAERLGQRPLRKGIGRITLVIDRKGAFKARIHQVGVEFRHLLGQHHAFVDQRPAGQRTDIHARDTRSRRCFLDAAADDIKLALELFLIQPFFIADQDLLNLGPGRIGLVAQHFGIHRHMTPTINVMAHAQHFGFHNCAAPFLGCKIGAR